LHTKLSALQKDVQFSGNIAEDVKRFLNHHGYPKTVYHSADVAEKSRELANQFGVNADDAEIAGWLHDSSVVFPSSARTDIARAFDVAVLSEEDIFPMIIHQKLSVVIAQEVFDVHDAHILSAIGCHTTLKRDSSMLDKVVFVADKIAWDQPGTPPYLDDLMRGLDKTIDHAAFVYLDYLWQMRDKLKVVHPWTAEAHAQLKQHLSL